ncbi:MULTISPECIES: hypothetical protein [Hungatella]|nr:hypothetical protein [Hungatella hathewayi]
MTPKHVEVWDTSDEQYACQLFIDFDNRTVEVKPYDVKNRSIAPGTKSK